MSRSRAWTERWTPQRSFLFRQLGEPPLDQFRPGGAGRCEVQLEAGMGRQPATDRLGLVGGVVVADHVHAQLGGNLLVQLGQELGRPASARQGCTRSPPSNQPGLALIGAGAQPLEPRAEAQAVLGQILADRQARCTRVLDGSPSSVLLTQTARADSIVAGARRRDGERHGVRIGPVTDALLQHAACPVLIVPHVRPRAQLRVRSPPSCATSRCAAPGEPDQHDWLQRRRESSGADLAAGAMPSTTGSGDRTRPIKGPMRQSELCLPEQGGSSSALREVGSPDAKHRST